MRQKLQTEQTEQPRYELRTGTTIRASAASAEGAQKLVSLCVKLGREWKRSHVRVIAVLPPGFGINHSRKPRAIVVARSDGRVLSEYLDPRILGWR